MVKTMYDELILKLREDAEFLEISSKYNNTKNEFAERISQAADAIEKLSMRIHGDEAAIAGMKREIERMVVADKPRWIPVTERLPNGNGKYLVSGKDKVWVCEFMILGDVGGWCNSAMNPCVKYWMPLPEHPKDGET